MKHRSFIMLCLLAGSVLASAQDAASIIKASRNRIKADTVSSRSRMVITAKNGTATERLIDQYSKDDAQGRGRSVIVFQQPQAVAGTRFLSLESGGNNNDQWIYLPALNRVRRIAASEGSSSFMGTDFSYDDIASANRDANLDNHTLAREETLNGKACYVIESKPKDGSYQYSRMVSWIDKDTLISYKLELYDKRNALVKRVEMQDIKDFQGRLTPAKTVMTTVGAGTFTTIYITILKYDDPIPESVFTPRFLETGRP